MQGLRHRRDLGKIVDAARIRKACGGTDLCQLKPKPGSANGSGHRPGPSGNGTTFRPNGNGR